MYRKRKGGATIEAINTLRARLGKVVFIWVPSHLGIPCNAYADAIASAATNTPAQTPVTALVAAEIRSRPIVYQRPSGDTWDLADGPVFGEVRKGLLEWVRTKHDWKPSGTDDNIHARLATDIGRGPVDPTSATSITTSRRHARITCGMRTGTIPGGPQHEGVFLKAAANAGGFCAFALAGGCRACQRRGVWPAPPETNAHCLLECHSGSAGELKEWKSRVTVDLNHLRMLLGTIGTKADAAREIVVTARDAVASTTCTGDGWSAIRHVVGGTLPRWGDGGAADNDDRAIELVQSIQSQFLDRLEEWAQYMAATGMTRQGRWRHRGWLALVFNALKHGRRRPLFGPWPAATPVARRGPKSRIFMLLWREYMRRRDARTLDSWATDAPNTLYHALQHAAQACVQHVLLVQRPVKRARAHSRRHLRNARSRIFLKLWHEHLRIKWGDRMERRMQSRLGRVAACTRNAGSATAVNHRQTIRVNKAALTCTEVYTHLAKWPRRDKIGWVLSRLLGGVLTGPT